MTLTEVLVFSQADVEQLELRYNPACKKELRASALFHSPTEKKLAQLQREKKVLDKQRRRIVQEYIITRHSYKSKFF